jgi:excisionase family DNA binding protein
MELLTVNETANMLRVSPITIRRYIASGRLRAERVGHVIRIRREAIDEFIAPVAGVRTVDVDEEAPEDSGDLPGRPTSDDDPLWNIIGIGRSDGADDVATNKHKYLADAKLSRMG